MKCPTQGRQDPPWYGRFGTASVIGPRNRRNPPGPLWSRLPYRFRTLLLQRLPDERSTKVDLRRTADIEQVRGIVAPQDSGAPGRMRTHDPQIRSLMARRHDFVTYGILGRRELVSGLID